MTGVAAGLDRHRAGDLATARSMYLGVLAADPSDVDALHLLGVVERQLGRPEAAIELIGRAIELRCDVAEFHNNLGTALQSLARLDAAEDAFRRALQLRPAYFDALCNLANALCHLEKFAEAVGWYRTAQALQPKNVEVACRLGIALARSGKLDDAIASFRSALTLRPDDAASHYELATALVARQEWPEAIASYRIVIAARPEHPEAHYNLGVALLGDGRPEEAEASFRNAIKARPGYVDALINLGRTLDELGRIDEAIASYDAAIAIEPDRADAHYNRGVALRRLELFDEAIASYRCAVDLAPRHANAQYNLGAALSDTGRAAEAIAHYEAAIEAEPDHAYAHLNAAVAHLLLGDFAPGWREYEWRWKVLGDAQTRFAAPAWEGKPLRGRTILLHAEQGFGDSIQFMRYVPLVAAQAGRVVLEIQPELTRLADTLDGDVTVVARGQAPPRFDVHAPLLGLPRVFGTTLATVPATVPYVHADHRLAAAWRDRIRAGSRPNVAIVWSGNPNHKNDRNRSIDAAEIGALIEAADAQFFSLQLGARADPGRGVIDLSAYLTDFAETAAALERLDLLVTVDTSAAHLAGALGVPAWVMLPFVPDWRWLLNREDSPWYPSMRLFRQSRPGDWCGVLRRVAQEIGRWNEGRSRRSPKFSTPASPDVFAGAPR